MTKGVFLTAMTDAMNRHIKYDDPNSIATGLSDVAAIAAVMLFRMTENMPANVLAQKQALLEAGFFNAVDDYLGTLTAQNLTTEKLRELKKELNKILRREEKMKKPTVEQSLRAQGVNK